MSSTAVTVQGRVMGNHCNHFNWFEFWFKFFLPTEPNLQVRVSLARLAGSNAAFVNLLNTIQLHNDTSLRLHCKEGTLCRGASLSRSTSPFVQEYWDFQRINFEQSPVWELFRWANRTKRYFTSGQRLMLYKALIRPHMELRFHLSTEAPNTSSIHLPPFTGELYESSMILVSRKVEVAGATVGFWIIVCSKDFFKVCTLRSCLIYLHHFLSTIVTLDWSRPLLPSGVPVKCGAFSEIFLVMNFKLWN